MINIVICEDEDIQRRNLERAVRDIIAYSDHEINIALSTYRAEDIIEYTSINREEINIYFLDIDLKDSIDGLALAAKIREQDVNGFIVFITAFAHMSYKTFEYKLEAMDYIVKDIQGNIKDRVESCINKAIISYSTLMGNDEQNCRYYHLNTPERNMKVKYDDIMFFETTKTNRKLRIHMKNAQIEFTGYIKDVEKETKGELYRCHRGYLVNVKNIVEIDKENDVLRMVNGEDCLYSRRLIKGVLDKWKV
jgi:two-component system response regulator AgrA